MLVIGDEILSGRTKDKNIGYIADYLTDIGIRLEEVRIVSDVEDRIVEAVNALRTQYTYLFMRPDEYLYSPSVEPVPFRR